MSIRESARQAWQSSHDEAARQALGEVLSPFDVSTLNVADMRLEAPVRFVFTDGDVHLAVVKGEKWAVSLVEDQDGWTKLADVVSLVQLGSILPPLPEPEDYPVWVFPPTKEQGYALGARVTHKGGSWESLKKENQDEPGADGVTSWVLL